MIPLIILTSLSSVIALFAIKKHYGSQSFFNSDEVNEKIEQLQTIASLAPIIIVAAILFIISVNPKVTVTTTPQTQLNQDLYVNLKDQKVYSSKTNVIKIDNARIKYSSKISKPILEVKSIREPEGFDLWIPFKRTLKTTTTAKTIRLPQNSTDDKLVKLIIKNSK